MKNKILRIVGFFLVALGLSLFGAMLIMPETMFEKIFSFVLVAGGLGSIAAMAIMTIGATSGESMKCPACGREVDALLYRRNNPQEKVCADCYVSEDLKKEQEDK